MTVVNRDIDNDAGRNQPMINSLNVTTIMVLDKDEALDFYVNKLGLEVGSDFKQGDYRWLTVRVPGENGTEISLEQPGSPLHDDATAAQLRELITKGALVGLVFTTDDARALYETLKERGVTDFTQEPTDHFYGTDMGVRDPFGNAIRILQRPKVAQEATA
jgi:catechol 2,3-dioxygenase-like lactoylglutathione lyase family enzyme